MKPLNQIMGFLKKTSASEKSTEAAGELFKKRYQSFQELLSSNNSVLELMADMEEKLSGEFLFDRQYIDSRIAAVSGSVRSIIENLNAVSKNKYAVLHERFQHIDHEIKKLTERKREIPLSSYTLSFDEINREMTDTVGGKNANLGEVRNRTAIPTPEGFAITAFAYKRFMEHNGFAEKINEKLSSLSIDNIEELDRISKEIQDMVIGAEIPEDLENAIKKAVEGLRLKVEGLQHSTFNVQRSTFNVQRSTFNVQRSTFNRSTFNRSTFNFSVRSSALQEDGEFSFAGQYSTFLNVPPDLIPHKYKEVVASLFTPRAIFYYKTKGFQEYEMVMSVGILEMVNARAGGVMYSRDPNNPGKETVIISAIWGLGKCAVEGVVTPQTYIISGLPERAVIEKRIPRQETLLVCSPDGELKEILLSDDLKSKPCLNDEEIKVLAGYAVKLEDHYGCPQDIEWAIDKTNRIYILQTRHLTVQTKETTKPIPTRIAGYNILLDRGIIACKGIGFGKAYIIRTDEDLKNFPEGAVLVARHTSTKFVTVMGKASAIITDVGGETGHMASLAREFQVPAILDTGAATDIIKDGQEITVDAINCNIYEGRVNELIEFSEKREDPFKNTHLFKTLGRVLKWVVPLNLVDPDDENFKQEFCLTFHDITRFAHEKAMHEMFKITETPSGQAGEARRLAAGIPLDAYIIDLGGGIKGTAKKLLPEHIRSMPFNAFFKGLASMRWPEARPFDVKGFLGMVAHTATIPEEELQRTGEKSFSFIAKEYMNFSIRLGYHLSTVEAYAGENINDNYIRFFFKGGGAVRDRKLRRVRLITEILKKLDFRVTVSEDVIDANITKYREASIEEKLEILGKLTVYTKQLDMVMYNDPITDWYIEEFEKEHMKNMLKVEG